MQKYTTQKIKEFRKPKPRVPILQAISERFSPRWFSPEPIPEKDVDRMFEAARWAPSGRNLQPWYFYIVQKGKSSYNRVFSAITEHNQWSAIAPLLVVACYLKKDPYGENPFALYDLGAAVFSLVLQAQSMGYYTRQMGLFDKETLVKAIGIDSSHTPFVILAIGKIGDYTKINKELLDRELSPHERKRDLAKRLK